MKRSYYVDDDDDHEDDHVYNCTGMTSLDVVNVATVPVLHVLFLLQAAVEFFPGSLKLCFRWYLLGYFLASIAFDRSNCIFYGLFHKHMHAEELGMSSNNAEPPREIAVEEDREYDPNDTMLPPDDGEISSSENALIDITNRFPGERVVTLLAMFTGQPFEVDAENEEPFCKYEKRSEFRLTKKILTAESKRRLSTYEDVTDKVPNSHKSNLVFIKYLKDNPISDPRCIAFLQEQKHAMVNHFEVLVNTSSDGSVSAQWRGNKPFLRLYHVILDDRGRFLARDQPLTREELDRPDKSSYWEWAAGKYNDPTFVPKSEMYPLLHHDFAAQIDLDTEGLPLPTNAETLKKKLADCRFKLLEVIRKFDISGNGDGSVLEPEDGTDPYVADATEKCAFLGNYNSHILYLWELCDDYDLLNSVKAVLPDDCSVNGSTIASCSLTSSARKKLKIAVPVSKMVSGS